MAEEPSRDRLARLARFALGAVLALTATLALAAPPAAAHVELQSTDPENFGSVDQAVTEIRLTFSGDAEPDPGRFAIEGPVGPVAISGVDAAGPVLTVIPAVPLEGGRHRIRWAIRAGDTHTMDGSVVFTVTTGTPTPAAGPEVLGAAAMPSAGASASTPVAERVATLARWFLYLALLGCVGALPYQRWVHRGTVAEGRRLVFLVRRAAVVVLLAALVELIAQVVDAGGGVLVDAFGVGTLLRLVGAGLVLGFLRLELEHAADTDEPPVASTSAGSGRTGGGTATSVRPAPVPSTRVRVEASPVAWLGAAVLLLSEAFLGHTATTQPRFLVVVSDLVHLASAGVWATGAMFLALTLGGRHRRGRPLAAGALATRFSVLATGALVAVAVTGVVLAWTILDGVGDLWGTAFGRVLLAKIAVVAVAAGIGAYNHRVLLPAFAAPPDGLGVDDRAGARDPVSARFRRTVTLEAGTFVLVVGLTALLVGADPT